RATRVDGPTDRQLPRLLPTSDVLAGLGGVEHFRFVVLSDYRAQLLKFRLRTGHEVLESERVRALVVGEERHCIIVPIGPNAGVVEKRVSARPEEVLHRDGDIPWVADDAGGHGAGPFGEDVVVMH